MTESSGGYYEYYESTRANGHWFVVKRISTSVTYNSSSAYTGFNGTDLTIGGTTDCEIDPTPAHYYLIVWKPNTPFNSSDNPVISASTTLPDDESMQTIYLKHNNIWNADGAKYAVYYFYNSGATDNGWSGYMTETSCLPGTFETEIPALYSKVIFVRLNPAGGINWESKWNQTEDQTIPANKDYFIIDYINGGYADNSRGHWDVYYCQPTKIYLNHNNLWNADGARYAVYYWNASGNHWLDLTRVCSTDVYTAVIPAGFSDFILCRMNGGTSDNNWSNCWNKTVDLSAKGHDGYCYTPTSCGNPGSGSWSGSAYHPTYYSITFNANGGIGSMETIDSICPSGSETLPANTFNRYAYAFAGWNTAANGSGMSYADGATINSISSNITLYAQWEEGCDVLAAGHATAGPSFAGTIGTVTVHQSNNAIKSTYDNSTATYTYLRTSEYIKLLPKAGMTFAAGDSLIVEIFQKSNSNPYTTGFVLAASNDSIGFYMPNQTSHIFKYQLKAADISGDGSVRLLRYDSHAGFMSVAIRHCPSTVDISGTVQKSNVARYSTNMTWYGDHDEYFDFGPTDRANLDRWAEWDINLLCSGKYTITEEYYCTTGRGWKFALINPADRTDTISTYLTGSQEGNTGTKTYTTKWDLSSVPAGEYILCIRNVRGWAQPKLKSLTLTHTGCSVSFTKAPNQAQYGKAGDSSRATGEINTPTVETTGIAFGTPVDTTDNVLTIGSVTLTAPLTNNGRLTGVPTGGGTTSPSCVWRFDHWEHVPTSVAGDIDSIRAVYIPTFNVEYNTMGGTINDAVYTTWYEYTGLSSTETDLPVNVTKDGYTFAGWYQSSTALLFTSITGNYYGDYRGEWCLKAHWVLTCDEPQTLSKVTLTGSGTSSYTVEGYDEEYVGTPVVSVSASSIAVDADGDGNNETGYQLGADNDIVFATLRTGGFRAGDVIRVTLTKENTTRRVNTVTSYLTFYYGIGTSDAQMLFNKGNVTGPGVYEYVLDADDVMEMNTAHANGVGVFREAVNGENPYVYSVEIFGCRDLVFDDNNNTHLWSDPKNWGPTHSEIPAHYQATRILKPCIVDIDDAHAKSVKLCREYSGHDGSLTIAETAALAVVQRVSEVWGTDYTTLHDVAAENLVIKSSDTHQGALIHGDDGSHTHATVEFYARGAGSPNADATWQYMGVPFSDITRAQSHYEGSWMCQWIENTVGNAGSNWKWVNTSDALTPFVGYALSNSTAKTFTNVGTLVASTDQTLSLTYAGTDYKGWNMFANSWMAPIQITHFEASDFDSGVQATIYLFNTGNNNGNQATYSATSSPGQYVAVPIATAGEMATEYQFIAPMQGFYIVTEAAGNVALNYDRLVRNPENHESDPISVRPSRSPRHATQYNRTPMPRIIIDVEGNRFGDRLYLFENEERTHGFDNAWDGYKFEGEAYAPQLMTRTGDLDLAVDVSPSFGGKRIAFRIGEDNEYTLRFSTNEEGLYLRDLLNGDEVAIMEGGEYTFLAFNQESEERFEIIDRRHSGEVPTGIEEIGDGSSAAILEMAIYTADGRLVLHRTTDFNDPLLLPETGVYIVCLKTTTGLQVLKITF